MTNQTLAATAARILRQPFVQKIGFDLNGLTVTGMRYSMVAKAIEDGKIECRVEADIKPTNKDELAPDTKIEAQYRASQNAMVFPSSSYGSLGWEERTIFHEATHAIFDLFATSANDRTLAIDDETAAVLAEAHYVRLCPRPTGNFAMWVDGRGERALKIVDKMMAETGDFERKRGTYFLMPQQTASLREAVAADWHFVKYIDSQGYPTDSTGVQYIYDGVVSCYSCWASGARGN
jgi:hypothetical protein